MQLVIDIPEDVYTRLFDNGIQDNEIAVDDVCEMARAIRLGTPLEEKTGRCKDCKWWRESDGTYRRDVCAESICPINNKQVYDGNGYCCMFKPKAESEE